MKFFTSFKRPSIIQKLSILVFAIVLIPTTSFSQIIVTLTTADNAFSGFTNWIVPCGVTQLRVTTISGGGAGGEGDKQGGSNHNGGGGGGGGEVRQTVVIPVTAGDAIPFRVGRGGIATNPALLDGANTIFGNNITFPYTRSFGALAGTNAVSNVPGLGGVGGSGGNGGVGTNGFNGEDGAYINPGPGYGGFGGNSGLGSGGAIQTTVVATGLDAPGIGGGGAGGYGQGSDGGSGGDGVIVILMTGPSAGTNNITLAPCVNSITMDADALTGSLVGFWSNLSGPGTIVSPTSPTTDITGLAPGVVYTVDWTIIDPATPLCDPLIQTITFTTTYAIADAGFDAQLCVPAFSLNGNAPPVGVTGTWTCVGCVAAGVTPVTSNNPTQLVSGFNLGDAVVFTWTFDGGGACVTTDDVNIDYPLVCNDGPCGAFVIPTSGCLAGEVLDVTTGTPSVGMQDPGCALYAGYADIWYSYVMPASGFADFSFLANGTDDIEVAVYSGACNNLSLEFCNAIVSGTNNVNVVFTPGQTVYFRVWERLDSPMTFDVCNTSVTNTSEVLPGIINLIDCTGSGDTFYDPGGLLGDYGDNQNVVYYICPPSGSFASVDFTALDFGTGDQLTILDGAASSAPLIAVIDEFTSPLPTITASGANGDSCLTLIWMSDFEVGTVGAGWEADVDCAATPGTLPAICVETECLGGCMPTICAIPGSATFLAGGANFTQELNESNNGCFEDGANVNGDAEYCSSWFLVNPSSSGTFTLDIYVNSGQNHDFMVFEGFAPFLDCPSLTSNQPIRCNVSPFADEGTGFNSNTSGTTLSGTLNHDYTANPAYEPEIVITPADIAAGIYYLILLRNSNNGCSNPEVDLAFGGTASVTCEPPSILPVELIKFAGDTEGRYNMLYWQTASEIENDYFTLLGSANGSDWQQLAIIDGAGTTQEKQNYEFEDDILSLEMTYYKLKQTDFNGNFKFSETIVLARDFVFNTLFSSVYPNPSDETFYFMYGGHDFNTPIIATIYNNLGQVVISQEYTIFSDDQANSINCEGLAAGAYNIVLSQGDKHEIQKISIIQ